MLTIDAHTHILPESIPDFKSRFGYGGFIKLESIRPDCCRMMRDDGKFFREIGINCWDAKTRIKECHSLDVHIQVLSTVPVMFNYWAKPQDTLEICQFLNNHIAALVAENPQHFVGLATLPMQDPSLSVVELERCVNELGLLGVQIGTHIEDKNLNHKSLEPVFEKIEQLNAALFVHPWDMMGQSRMPDYWLPWLVGMPAETSLAICSMIFGGIFAKFPKMRVCFAHGGGSFGATIGRIEHGFLVRPDLCAVDNPRNPRDYLGHFYVDSLVHDVQALKHLVDLYGPDKILLGSDYPFPLGEERPGHIIRSSTFLQTEEKAKILGKNALKWLGIDYDFENRKILK